MSWTSWILIGWGACAAGIVIFERLLARHATGFLDPDHPVRSVAVYAMFLILSPFLLPVAIAINARKIRKWLPWMLWARKGPDPYLRYDEDWPAGDSDLLVGMLLRRRKLFDARLKRADIDNWPMHRFRDTPEAILFETVDAHRDLRAGGAKDWQIWEKLDAWLDADGPPMPHGAALSDYLKSRLRFIDPVLVELGDQFLSGHIDICERWLEKTNPAEGKAWPPREWLTRQLTFAEFESLGADSDGYPVGTPAVLHLSRSERGIVRLNLRMLAGDQIWAFSSPPDTWRALRGREGLALVRNGRSVAHVVTGMN